VRPIASEAVAARVARLPAPELGACVYGTAGVRTPVVAAAVPNIDSTNLLTRLWEVVQSHRDMSRPVTQRDP